MRGSRARWGRGNAGGPAGTSAAPCGRAALRPPGRTQSTPESPDRARGGPGHGAGRPLRGGGEARRHEVLAGVLRPLTLDGHPGGRLAVAVGLRLGRYSRPPRLGHALGCHADPTCTPLYSLHPQPFLSVLVFPLLLENKKEENGWE